LRKLRIIILMLDADSASFDRSQLRSLATELGRQPRSVLDALLHALRPMPGRRPLDAGLWGRAPAPRTVRTAAADNLALGVARRSAVVVASVTRREVAHALGKSDQAVSAMLERGSLLGLKEGREWRIPVWQLDADRPAGVLPGLAEVARAYRDGIVSLSEWVQRPNPDLDGATPRQVLASGDVARVVAAAANDT
jgi:hypothetical protein